MSSCEGRHLYEGSSSPGPSDCGQRLYEGPSAPGPSDRDRDGPSDRDGIIERKLDRWVEAKRQRNFTLADQLRSELEKKGVRAELARPHMWEAPSKARKPGTHGGGAAAAAAARSNFGYVPPSQEEPWGQLRENSGKLVAQEGSVVPMTSKAVEGAFRPRGMQLTGAKRTGEAGGFREFDDAEAERRKQRALEVKAETSARKAERKKCEYCKRASCIC